jgi:glycosyltransferase involved in cell wall biosynthesis
MTIPSAPRATAVALCPIVPEPPTSGGAKRTLRLLEALERANLTPHVLTADTSRPDGVEALRARGWAVDVLPAPAPTLAERAVQHLRRRPSPFLTGVDGRLRELAAAGTARLVLAEQTLSSYYGDAHPGVPWVFSTHNVDGALLATVARAQRPGTPAWAKAWNLAHEASVSERRGARSADGVLCVSEDDARHFRALGAAPVVVAPNGVDDDLFAIAEAPAGAPARALFFGRLDYAPNRLGLLRFAREAWPRVVAQRPDAELVVVGAGLDAAAAAELGALRGVDVRGEVADLRAEIAACRLTVVPIWQGGGTRLKVLESLAAGRPVAGTALGVAGVGFAAGEHGLAAEEPTELADAVLALLADPARAARLGAQGRALAEGFRWARVTEPAAALFAGLASGPS